MNMTRDAPELTQQSTADLVRRASDQIASLVRDELRLARAEMLSKARHAGVGAGLLGAAGILAGYGIGAVLIFLGLLLAQVVAAWLAAFVVGLGVFVLAGLLAVVGRSRLRRATPPVPVEALQGLRADVDEISAAYGRGGQR